MENGLNKLKRCSEKSDNIKKGSCMYSTGLLKWIVYSRAVYATKISNAKGRAPFEFTYSWRRCFPPFITHRGTFCSSLQEEAGRQLKSKKNRRNQNKSCRSITFHFLLLGHTLSSLLCHYFQHRRFPVPASVLFSFLSLSSETSAASGCSPCLSWSEADTSGPDGDCLRPTKTSFVSSPLGQWYPVKASISKIRRRGKHGSVGCLESLRKWSIERMIDLLQWSTYPSHCPEHPCHVTAKTFSDYSLKYQPGHQCISGTGCSVGTADIFQYQNYSLSSYFPLIFETRSSEWTLLKMPY